MYWRQKFPLFKSGSRKPDTLSNSRYFCFQRDQIVVPPVGSLWQPLNREELLKANAPIVAEHYLGQLVGEDCFAVDFDPEVRLADGFATVGLRQLLGNIEEEYFYLAGRAIQILAWDRTTRFCGACGQPTRHQNQDRSKICTACKIPIYPRLSPSIIVLVTRGEQVLLARNAAWGPNGFYSTLAGFVELGESIEETVHREVFEEVGIRVKNLCYLGSQSWPFPNSLMLGFHAEYESGEFEYHDEEIADAQWFSIDALPRVPARFAISRWLIEDYRARVKTIG